MKIGIIGIGCLLAVSKLAGQGAADLFDERAKAIVSVSYFLQREEERQEVRAVGLVMDDEGRIVCLNEAFADWVPQDWFRNIEIFPVNNPAQKPFTAEYLGQDLLNGWHYLQVEPDAMEYLTPITAFGQAVPRTGELLWGIGMANEDLDYAAYYLDSALSIARPLPLMIGIAADDLVVPGSAVFNGSGEFVGWGVSAFPEERDVWIGGEYYRISMRNPEETRSFIFAESFFQYLGQKIATNPEEQRRAWLGVTGTEALDKESAGFLGLVGQGALIFSEVLPNSPADTAGLGNRDILVGMHGEPLPRFKPENSVLGWFELEIAQRNPGDILEMEILRGSERLEVEVELGTGPRGPKTADYTYFKDLGFSARNMLVGDAIQRRVDYQELSGAIVSYVRPNSPAATAELRIGDWIQQIDGKEAEDWRQAKGILENAEGGDSEEVVFLVRRANDTAVLRLQRTPE